ncbi:bifunctional oligoribonuclease/PAP phosphatase NrnA [Patescibacteria group bacterium]
MSEQLDLNPVQESLASANNILVVIGKNPNHDTVASGLSIYLSLKSSGKNVEVACPSPMLVEFSRLVGLDKVKEKVGNKNLVVSFDYIQDGIEKVNYNVKNEKFNLIVQPKKGAKPLDSKNVSFSYSGMQADMIFIIGASSLGDLGVIYKDNQESFDSAYTISLNKTLQNSFAQTTISDDKASSISEITVWFLEQTGYQPKNDIASNLLSGVDMSTNRFSSPNTPPSAFKAAAKLMENGARRQFAPAIIPKLPQIPTQTKIANQGQKPLVGPMTQDDSQKTPPKEEQLKTNDEQEEKQEPPKEWLEPKIFRGSTKV